MTPFIVIVNIFFVSLINAKEYGYLFDGKDSFIQTKYALLCNESAVKLELYINVTSGVIFYAENLHQGSSILVYFKLPGIYMNATMGKNKFNLPFMLDFFDNDWIGWHEIEIRIDEKTLGLVLDGKLREEKFVKRHLFPEKDIEDNVIYFGLQYSQNGKFVQGFQGLMRNFRYKSCGCDEWRSVKIINIHSISLENLGNCADTSICKKECSCILMQSGKEICDCSGQQCLKGKEIFYGFDKESSIERQLKLISKSENVHYTTGIFGESFDISNHQWLILSINSDPNCFKNIFFCEKELYYQFWLRPLPYVKVTKERILKHSSFIDSIYGFDLIRIQDRFQISLTTNINRQFNLKFSVPLLIWSRITVSFNFTHLKVFLDSRLSNITTKYKSIDNEKPKIINTKYFMVGNKNSNPNVEIDNFYFSLDENILYYPSIQTLKIEQQKGLIKANLDCRIGFPDENGMVNITECCQEQFKDSNFSLGFYVSIIFDRRIKDNPIQKLLEFQSFSLFWRFPDFLEIKMKNQIERTIKLRRTTNKLCYLEIFLSSKNTIVISQESDIILNTIPFDMDISFDNIKHFYAYMNGNAIFLKSVTLVNVNKDIGTRAFRIPTNKIEHWMFDSNNISSDGYLPIKKINDDFGIEPEEENSENEINSKSLLETCMKNVELCYHGFMILFSLKFKKEFHISPDKPVAILSFGLKGITLLMDNNYDFILIISPNSSVKFLTDNSQFESKEWILFRFTMSSNKIFSLFIDNINSPFVITNYSKAVYPCSEICVGNNKQGMKVPTSFYDEIHIWNVEKDFLYANGFLSETVSYKRSFSFTNYQKSSIIKLNGSVKLIPTKYGEAVSLNGFGPGFATVDLSTDVNCFTNIDKCKRGLMIRLWLRIDNIALHRQVFLSSSEITVGTNFGSLFVHMSSMNKSWFFKSDNVFRVFTWQHILISWRLDSGMKVFLNDALIGYITSGSKNGPVNNQRKPVIYFGKDYSKNAEENVGILIKSVELFESDKSHMAYERKLLNLDFESPCKVFHTFDEELDGKEHLAFGVVGIAGIFDSNSTISRKIFLPSCFNRSVTLCQNCFSLRLWINLNKFNSDLLKLRMAKVYISMENFVIDIVENEKMELVTFICIYPNEKLIKNWNFLEISWETEEGLVVFINRELLSCQLYRKKISAFLPFSDNLEFSETFQGAVDELELFMEKLAVLYMTKVIDEIKIDSQIRKIRDKKRSKSNTKLLQNRGKSRNKNASRKVIYSIEFNGSNYVEYKMSINNDSTIPGAAEEIELEFESFNTDKDQIIWISGMQESLTILSIEKKSLFLIKSYLLLSNGGMKNITEQFQILRNIKPNERYKLMITQKSEEILIKVYSHSQSVIGKNSLFPIGSKIYLGGPKELGRIKLNEPISNFIGMIYKARIKSIFNIEPTDIIQEMVLLKSETNIINHGNVKPVSRPSSLSESSFLETLSNKKVSLMIYNFLTSLTIPKLDFEIIINFEMEFTTLESNGLLFFIGNSSHFVIAEIFHSKIYFTIKSPQQWKRIGLKDDKTVVNNGRPHNIFIGRDLSGNIMIFFDKKVVLNSLKMSTEIHNSSMILGFFGSYQLWPIEIMSKIGIIGCIHYIGINNIGYLDFFKWNPKVNQMWNEFNLLSLSNKTFLINKCLSPLEICTKSLCNGGLCQSTIVSFTGQLIDNYKCDCFYSERILGNSFTYITEMENFQAWIRNYLLSSRSNPCTKDSTSVVIVENSFLETKFQLLFPFSMEIDFEFMLLLKSTNSCVLRMFDDITESPLKILIINRTISLKISKLLTYSFVDVPLHEDQWNTLQLTVRFGLFQLKINNVDKFFNSIILPFSKVSTITIGKCSEFSESHFKIKNLMYNQLNLLENIHHPTTKNLFYKTQYFYPDSRLLSLNNSSRAFKTPITFLNHFRQAQLKTSFKLLWLNVIELFIKVQYPGSFVHFLNGNSFLTLVMCYERNLNIIFNDGHKGLEIKTVSLTGDKFEMKISIDLIKNEMVYSSMDLKSHEWKSNIYSWNIGDEIQIQFGSNAYINKQILSPLYNRTNGKCSETIMENPLLGCIETFTLSNGKVLLDFSSNWKNLMQSYPSSSVLFNECKDVKRCLSNFCSNGVCKSRNFFEIFCDCQSTEFFGSQCHIPRQNCNNHSCKNGGKCVIERSEFSDNLLLCDCKGTGFKGNNCEEPLCKNDSCLHHGKCYVKKDIALCNCTSTGFYGEKCELSLCNSTTCNKHGLCHIHPISKTPICDCTDGYFGEKCEISSLAQCQASCFNGGICSLFEPTMKLCSKRHCQSVTKFKCNCHETFYRGQSCKLPEYGFDPSLDGIVVMKRLSEQRNNYLRILFEPWQKINKMYLFELEYEDGQSIHVYMEEQLLWLSYRYGLHSSKQFANIGILESTNILMVLQNSFEINFYFNSKLGSVLLSQSVYGNINRQKRSPKKTTKYLKLTVGSNSQYQEIFHGLIGGINWNNQGLLNSTNIIWKGNETIPIERLQTRRFPRNIPILMFSTQRSVSVDFLLVIPIFLYISVILYNILKRRFRNTSLKIYKSTKIRSKVLTEIDSVQPDRAKLLNAKCQPSVDVDPNNNKIINDTEKVAKIILINNINCLQNLIVLDLLIIPQTSQIALILSNNFQFKILQKLFPLNLIDKQYLPTSIRISSDNKYSYCHMKEKCCDQEDLVELQVWEIKDKWNLISTPPNVSFTDSISTPGLSSDLILLNRCSNRIFIWAFDQSMVMREIILNSFKSLNSISITPSSTCKYLILNNECQFHIVDLIDNCHKVSSIIHDFPFSDGCRQLLSIQENNFLIRTDSNGIFVFNAGNHCFKRKLEGIQIIEVVKIEHKTKLTLAMAKNTGEIYLTDNIEKREHVVLGPSHKNQLVCLQFSPDATFLCAGYENNLIHVWKIFPEVSICHFYAIHDSTMIKELQISSDNRYIISSILINSVENGTEMSLRIIEQN